MSGLRLRRLSISGAMCVICGTSMMSWQGPKRCTGSWSFSPGTTWTTNRSSTSPFATSTAPADSRDRLWSRGVRADALGTGRLRGTGAQLLGGRTGSGRPASTCVGSLWQTTSLRTPITYDAVVTFQVMEHVPAVGHFLRQCLDCLRPEGRLIISVPSHDGFIGGELNSILDLPPHHITQWSDRCMAAMASEFDLNLVSLDHDEIAPYHRVNYLHQKSLNALGLRRTDERPVRSSSAFRSVDRLVSKAAGVWGRIRRPALPPGFGHSVTACYERQP